MRITGDAIVIGAPEAKLAYNPNVTRLKQIPAAVPATTPDGVTKWSTRWKLCHKNQADEIVNVQIPKIKNPRPFEIFPAANLVQKSANPRANPVPINYEIQLSISCSSFLLATIAH